MSKFNEIFDAKLAEHVQGFKDIEEACGMGSIDGKWFIKKRMSALRIYWRMLKLKIWNA